MIEVATDFPFLGDREYVHGTSILSGFLNALEQQGAKRIRVQRLKFLRTARSNGVMMLARSDAAEPGPAEANCILKADADGTAWLGWFFERGTDVARRESVTYPIANVQASGFAGSCDLHPAGRDELIRALVEANKRLHEAGVDGKPGRIRVRFGYLENWNAPARDICFQGRLDAKNLITQQTNGGYLTVNRLTYAPAGAPATTLLLCFNVDTDPGESRA